MNNRQKWRILLASLALTSDLMAAVVYQPMLLKPLVTMGTPVQEISAWPVVGKAVRQVITPQISVQDLQQRLNTDAPTTLLVDVRTPEEYQAGHIPGAILIPLHEIEAGPGVDKILALMSNSAPNSTPELITYCAVGPRSHRALAQLREVGITGTNMTGGYTAWQKWLQASS